MKARLGHGFSRRRALVAAALLASVMFATSSLAAGSSTQWLTRTVHAYRVSMAIDTILDSTSNDPKHAPDFEHRVRVIVFEDNANRSAGTESVSLDVALLGYRGLVVPLTRASGEQKVVFEGRVSMIRGRTYRILVHFRPSGSGVTHEVQYQYRHHH